MELRAVMRYRHKYNVAPPNERTCDGILFGSKKEMNRYIELKQLRDDCQVVQFFHHVRVPVGPKTKYEVDFLVFWADGRVSWEDTKGVRTQVYKLKKRQFETTYPPFEIEEM
jgi:hypothetical protein